MLTICHYYWKVTFWRSLERLISPWPVTQSKRSYSNEEKKGRNWGTNVFNLLSHEHEFSRNYSVNLNRCFCWKQYINNKSNEIAESSSNIIHTYFNVNAPFLQHSHYELYVSLHLLSPTKRSIILMQLPFLYRYIPSSMAASGSCQYRTPSMRIFTSLLLDRSTLFSCMANRATPVSAAWQPSMTNCRPAAI